MSGAVAQGDARHARGRGWHALPPRSKRRFLLRAAGVAIAVAVVAFLCYYATTIDWDGVFQALRRYQPAELAIALGFAVLSHLAYGAFDLVGRAYTKHKLSRRMSFAVGLVGYAFSLNIGAMVGGAVSRLRLYTRLGLGKGTVAKIVTLSIATNWLAWMLLAGAVFVAQAEPAAEGWVIGRRALQAIGVLLLGLAFAYVMLCAYSTRRSFTVRAHTLILPSVRLAIVQFALGLVNWLAIGAVLYVLFDGHVPYLTLLGVLFLAVVATLIVRVPAGIGPFDAVFLALLAAHPRSIVIAALLAYRAVYYLVPLAIAVPGYLLIERLAGRRKTV